MNTRRAFLRQTSLAVVGGLVSAEAVHDFCEWQSRRIFALGSMPVRQPGTLIAHLRIPTDRHVLKLDGLIDLMIRYDLEQASRPILVSASLVGKAS